MSKLIFIILGLIPMFLSAQDKLLQTDFTMPAKGGRNLAEIQDLAIESEKGGFFDIQEFLTGYQDQEYVISVIGEPVLREKYNDTTYGLPHEGFAYYLEGETVLMAIYFYYYHDECRCWGIEKIEFYPVRSTDGKIEKSE